MHTVWLNDPLCCRGWPKGGGGVVFLTWLCKNRASMSGLPWSMLGLECDEGRLSTIIESFFCTCKMACPAERTSALFLFVGPLFAILALFTQKTKPQQRLTAGKFHLPRVSSSLLPLSPWQYVREQTWLYNTDGSQNWPGCILKCTGKLLPGKQKCTWEYFMTAVSNETL